MMRKALLSITLVLGGASAAAGQQYLNHCSGEAYTGPVRSVRVERARFAKDGDRWVEGPRRLTGLTVYSDDRRRAEHTSFDDAGKPHHIYLRVCYEDGNQAEYSVFDGERRLVWREVYARGGGESIRFDAAGQVKERTVNLRDETGRRIIGHETYDGRGALIRKHVNTTEAGKSVWSTYDGEGRLREKAIYSLNDGGSHHGEFYKYNPDGTVAQHSASQSDAAVTRIEKGPPARRQYEEREYDSHRNLVKHTSYRQNPATGEREPFAVSYHEITYF